MLLGLVLLHAYYAVLRANRADVAADTRHPRVELISMLNICRTKLPAIHALFSDYPLPPDVCVLEPRLLSNFPTFVEDLPADQRPTASVRLNVALRLELIAMLVGVLDSDYYWTERSLLLPTPTSTFLCEAETSNFPTVVSVDGASRGSFSIYDVVQRSTDVQLAGLRLNYLWIYMRDRDNTVLAYRDNEGDFLLYSAG